MMPDVKLFELFLKSQMLHYLNKIVGKDLFPGSAISEIYRLAKLLFCAELPSKLQEFPNNGMVAIFLKNLTFFLFL